MTLDIIVRKKNENYLQIDCPGAIAYELYDHFSFMVPGAKFMPQYRSGSWDGYVHLFSSREKTLPFGLLMDLMKFAKRNSYSIEFDRDEFRRIFSDEEISDYKSRLPELTKYDLSSFYSYQWEAVEMCLRTNRLLICSPTGSGKSQVIYLLTRFLIENNEGNILIVVPTISLTTQLKGDFQSYVNDEFDVEANVSLLGGGNKAENKRVLISTWQSLIKQPSSFFGRFAKGALIVDECHLAEAKSITTIVQRLPDTKFKFGFTGTIADAKCSELQLKGLFGPIYQTKTTKELQKEGVLSDLEIRVTKLKYPKIEIDGFWALSPDYQKEVDWLSKHPSRNEFIANLALSQSPKNTLILYNFIEHGKNLYDILREGREESHTYLINGSTPPNERERIRDLTERENGVIIIASSALFSTGVNIRNLTTLIFAHSYKAKIRNLQSIGRSLRIHKDKEKAILYDITDDLSKGRKSNTTLRHMVERVKIYQREGFDYVLNEVTLDELCIL